jgi:hypothetical protein
MFGGRGRSWGGFGCRLRPVVALVKNGWGEGVEGRGGEGNGRRGERGRERYFSDFRG